MSNVVNIADFKKENLNIVILNSGERVGFTLDFLVRVKTDDLKNFHDLGVKMYLDFIAVKPSTVDYYIDNYDKYNKLLNKA